MWSHDAQLCWSKYFYHYGRTWAWLFTECNALQVETWKPYSFSLHGVKYWKEPSVSEEGADPLIISQGGLFKTYLSLETELFKPGSLYTWVSAAFWMKKNNLYCSSTHYCNHSDCVSLLQYFYLPVSWDKNVLWPIKPELKEHWTIGCVHYTCNGTVNTPKQAKWMCFCKDWWYLFLYPPSTELLLLHLKWWVWQFCCFLMQK